MAADPHAIPLAEAVALTARWRQQMPPGGIKAGRFDRIAFDTLLGQPGAAGVRIYLGMQPDLSWTFVLVGTDATGNDMVAGRKVSGTLATDAGGGVEEDPFRCPPDCDCDSPLNGDCPPP